MAKDPRYVSLDVLIDIVASQKLKYIAFMSLIIASYDENSLRHNNAKFVDRLKQRPRLP